MTVNLDIGSRVGRIIITGPIQTIGGKHCYSPVRCDCGKEWLARRDGIRKGRIVSCGCHTAALSAKRLTTHGQAHTPTYTAWASMIQRCTNPNAVGYAFYGGRGVSVCEAWHDFAGFYADMGDRPDATEIDRIDSNGDYEPGNCRWATRAVQMQNMRNNRWVVLNGERMIVYDATRRLGIGNGTAHWRAKHHGVTLQEAIDYYAEKAVRPQQQPANAA